MRHYKKGRKLGTDASHTAAIKKNLMVNLFLNDRIKTTLERAKEIRGDVDRTITWAKRGDVHSRRLAIAKLGDKQLVAEIFAKVEQGLFKDRPGGYTRIYKVGKRRGDDATIVLMELVQEPVQFKKKAASDDAEKSGLKVEKKAARGKKKAAEAEETKEAAVEEAKEAEETAAEDLEEAAAVEETQEAEEATETEETAATETPAKEETVAAEADAAKTEEVPAEEAAEAEEAPAEDESSTAAETPDAEEAPAEDESNK